MRVRRASLACGALSVPALLALVHCTTAFDASLFAARDAATNGALVDASDAAAPNGFCARATDALFCDDFDHGEIGASWRGWPPSFPGRVIGPDSGTELIAIESASSPPNVLSTFARLHVPPLAITGLAHSLTLPAEARGFEVSAAVRLVEFEDLRSADASVNVRDGGDPELSESSRLSAIAMAMPSNDSKVDGAQLVFSPKIIAVATGTLTDEQPLDLVRVASVSVLSVSRNQVWFGVTIAIGKREALVARAAATRRSMPTCPDTPAVAVVWSSFPLESVGCAAASDSLENPGGRAAVFAVGLGMNESAAARTLIDDVRLDAIP